MCKGFVLAAAAPDAGPGLGPFVGCHSPFLSSCFLCISSCSINEANKANKKPKIKIYVLAYEAISHFVEGKHNHVMYKRKESIYKLFFNL